MSAPGGSEFASTPSGHVGRLQIAMNDSAAVSERDCVADLDENLEQVGQHVGTKTRVACPVQSVFQRFAFDELHAQKPRTAPIASELVDGHDVRMLELSGDASFFREAFDFRLSGRPVFGEHFDGDVAMEILVEGTDDGGHPTAADHFALEEALAFTEDAAQRGPVHVLRLRLRHVFRFR